MAALRFFNRPLPRLPRIPKTLGLYPFELFAIGMAISALLFLRLNRLHYGWNTVVYTFPPLIRAIPRLFVFGVGLRIGYALVTRRSIKEYLRAVLTWSWLSNWLRAWVAIMLFIYTYCWLKVSVPLVRADLWDQEFWRLDRFLHFGLSPSVFAIELTAGTPLAPWLDSWYGFWVTSLAVIMAFFVATESTERLRNFTLTVVVLWTVGGWAYMAFPALGPCYASPDVLEPIHDQIPRAIQMQKYLWAQYLQMVQGRTGLLRTFQPEFGVAAMPSLHVGAHALFFFWCRRHDRWLRVPFAIATGLTFLGSLVTGWHYAVDGYAGILIAWFAVVLADRLDPIAGDPIADDPIAIEPAPIAADPVAAPPPPAGVEPSPAAGPSGAGT